MVATRLLSSANMPTKPTWGGKREEALALRATGLTLQQIGDRMGSSRQRIHQLLAAADAVFCHYCKLPKPLVSGRRRCSECYAKLMANRPSKRARVTGYRKSSLGHRRAWLVRAAKEGLTIGEAAKSLGVTSQTVWNIANKMRANGREIVFRDGRKKQISSPVNNQKVLDEN